MAAAFSNAIGWAQYRLLGGWANLLSTTGAYALILCTLMFGLAHGLHMPPARIYEAFIYLFFALQVLVALVYGTARVAGAIRSDMNSRLIESHRLMPVAPFQAVLGYLFGPSLQAFCVFAVNFVMGAVATAGAGVRQQMWFFSNVVLLLFCVFLWTIVAFFAFRSNWVFGLFVVGVVALLISPLQLLPLVAGLKVLVSPMIGTTIFDMRTGLTIDWPYLLAGGAQLVIGLLYLFAAARRYRRDDLIGFTPLMGLLLLGAWVGVSAVEMTHPGEFRQRGSSMLVMHRSGSFIIAILSCMLLAVLPIASATRAKVIPLRAHTGWWMPPAMALALAWLVVLAVIPGAPPIRRTSVPALAATALIAAAYLVSARYLLEIAYRLKLWPRRTLFIWLLITWCVPMMLELIRQTLLDDDTNDPTGPPMSIIGLSSPIGALLKIWTYPPQSVRGGVAFQVGTALFVVAVCLMVRQRRRSIPAPSVNFDTAPGPELL